MKRKPQAPPFLAIRENQSETLGGKSGYAGATVSFKQGKVKGKAAVVKLPW